MSSLISNQVKKQIFVLLLIKLSLLFALFICHSSIFTDITIINYNCLSDTIIRNRNRFVHTQLVARTE